MSCHRYGREAILSIAVRYTLSRRLLGLSLKLIAISWLGSTVQLLYYTPGTLQLLAGGTLRSCCVFASSWRVAGSTCRVRRKKQQLGDRDAPTIVVFLFYSGCSIWERKNSPKNCFLGKNRVEKCHGLCTQQESGGKRRCISPRFGVNPFRAPKSPPILTSSKIVPQKGLPIVNALRSPSLGNHFRPKVLPLY